MHTTQEFDQHADTYDTELNQALSVSGETKDYFARKRVEWVSHCLHELGEHPRSALDYGCGIGDTCPLLRDALGLRSITGLDTSIRSVQLAASRHDGGGYRFLQCMEHRPSPDMDLAYCNGVFHHIPVAERTYAVDFLWRCLRPGGLFAFWENNPWNPGTRWIMSRTPFDRGAITLSPPAARHLLHQSGFQIIHTSYLFFFPRLVKPLRILERHLTRIPIGGQYQVLCRKPSNESFTA